VCFFIIYIIARSVSRRSILSGLIPGDPRKTGAEQGDASAEIEPRSLAQKDGLPPQGFGLTTKTRKCGAYRNPDIVQALNT
jgi:hypothetical protein